MKKQTLQRAREMYFWVVLSFVLIICYSTPVNAEQTFKINDVVDIKIQCVINGTLCPNTATCNISAIYPNNSIFINNQLMSYNGAYFNYSLIDSSKTGYYKCSSTCCLGSACGTDSCDFQITNSGNSTDITTIFFYIAGLGVLIFFLILCIVSFVKFDNLLNRVFMVGIFYLLLIAITFIAYQMSLDFLSVSNFLTQMINIIFMVLMYGSILVMVGGFMYYMYMISKIKEIQNLINKGMSENEAEERVRNKRRKH